MTEEKPKGHRPSPDPYGDTITRVCERAYPDFWKQFADERHRIRGEALQWYRWVHGIPWD